MTYLNATNTRENYLAVTRWTVSCNRPFKTRKRMGCTAL